MVRLGRRRREILIQKAPDMANAMAVSTLIGQFLADRPYSIPLALVGTGGWLALWLITLAIAKDE